MPEILTESFCERCGTRYTFEATTQSPRLKGVKILSRGLKNFVMSDGTSMDEAMAAARSETDRESTSHQIDAFHQTFNFCMQCRQYTCPNCWNDVEARCLTCAPNLGHEILPAPFPDLALVTGHPNGSAATNGNGHVEDPASAGLIGAEEVDALARLTALTSVTGATPSDPTTHLPADDAAPETPGEWPAADAAPLDIDEVDVSARMLALTGGAPADPALPDVDATADATADDGPVPDSEFIAAVLAAPIAEPDGGAGSADAAPVDDVQAGPSAAEIAAAAALGVAAASADPDATSDIRDKATAQTGGLLRRFRPGQSLDAELEAYEREQAAAAADPAALAAAASVAATTGAPSEVPETVEAMAADVAPDETAPDLAIAASAAAVVVVEPEPVQPVDDVVVQPTWQRVAPDVEPTVPPTTEPSLPAAASASPQWPTSPQWPSKTPPTGGLPFLGRPAAPQGGIEALWAASAQEVAAPTPSRTANVIQPCVSCGLSLSATARFCRRCGTPQAG